MALISLLLLFLSPLTTSTSPAPPPPQDLLLTFKASLEDPSNALSSWSPALPFCNWTYITCTTPTSISISLQGLNLSGTISPSICHLPHLTSLDLAANRFNLPIPLHLSQCTSLLALNLSSNSFWGPLPDQLAMLTSLQSFDLAGNRIDGQLPPSLGALPELRVLNLGSNQLSGVLRPAVLGNLSRKLQFLDLSKNQFLESELPQELGGMKDLRWVFLQGSGFYGSIPEEFLGLEELEVLDLSMNNLSGVVPPGFGLKFQKLLSLDLSQNRLFGSFPEDIGSCVRLQRFEVQDNGFSGEFPAGVWSLPDLRVIRAENNRFWGRIPEFPGAPARLVQVQIDNNSFFGEVPRSFGLIRTLYQFSASANGLNGSLPDNLCDSPALSIINLSHNSLSGSIPQFGNCKRLVSLYLSDNGFTGGIPASLGYLPVLTYIDLSSNGLSGGIPEELQNLKLALLNLSYNQLSGSVPPALISGLPAVFLEGNPGLCGPGLPNECGSSARRRRSGEWRLALGAAVASFVAGLILLAAAVFAAHKFHKNKSSPWKIVLFYPIKITEDELLAALHEKNVIGRGAFGKVYRIQLHEGENIAVKRLTNSSKLPFRAVKNGMKVLARIRHKNLNKLLGFFYSNNEVMVFYEHLPKGSLEDMIRGPEFALEWKDRLRIVLGVAQGLVYLHKDYASCVLHRDLKSSNVLLDDQLEPRVTGFGLDRIVGERSYQSSMNSDLSCRCYIAPEHSCSKKPTGAMDVYSFGVILLELITGKPAEQPASREPLDIVRWVRRKINVTEGALQILDPGVRGGAAREEMLAALELALRCTSVMPDRRPAMEEVVRSLQSLHCCAHPPSVLSTEIFLA